MSAADLSHADWVVLSACDSGLGPIGRNEGVFGMRRALRLAGARTVVMSLWEADDATTADLMQALYRARFAEHRNVPDAMAAGDARNAGRAPRSTCIDAPVLLGRVHRRGWLALSAAAVPTPASARTSLFPAPPTSV